MTRSSILLHFLGLPVSMKILTSALQLFSRLCLEATAQKMLS